MTYSYFFPLGLAYFVFCFSFGDLFLVVSGSFHTY